MEIHSRPSDVELIRTRPYQMVRRGRHRRPTVIKALPALFRAGLYFQDIANLQLVNKLALQSLVLV